MRYQAVTMLVHAEYNALIHFEDGSHPDMYVNDHTQRAVTTVEDLVGEDEIWYMATSAVMFRNGIIKEYPQWFHESKSGDIPRYILLGKHGKFYYINEVMSVYRKNGGGMSFTDGKQDADFLFNFTLAITSLFKTVILAELPT